MDGQTEVENDDGHGKHVIGVIGLSARTSHHIAHRSWIGEGLEDELLWFLLIHGICMYVCMYYLGTGVFACEWFSVIGWVMVDLSEVVYSL
ncbi:hypothetical protein M426DRAFT_145098 [Hypoxylon sp. CI-4A]|nr:hypothetical protein M426DRAFT_145098 [Hypoxylon sp. CI-4A]